MPTPEFDLSNDCFILDRDQDEYLQLPQAQSTPTIQLYPQNGSPPAVIHDLYEIIKTKEEHTVLHHDTAPIAILSTASEEGPTIRRFTRDNPVIQDDINVSPPRDYNEMDSWLFAPINGTVSPISSHSSSLGYFSGSDWTTDSSWFTYDSLVQSVFQQPISSPFRPISPLPPVPDVPQESRGLSRPQRRHGTHTTGGTPEEESEEINQN